MSVASPSPCCALWTPWCLEMAILRTKPARHQGNTDIFILYCPFPFLSPTSPIQSQGQPPREQRANKERLSLRFPLFVSFVIGRFPGATPRTQATGPSLSPITAPAARPHLNLYCLAWTGSIPFVSLCFPSIASLLQTSNMDGHDEKNASMAAAELEQVRLHARSRPLYSECLCRD